MQLYVPSFTTTDSKHAILHYLSVAAYLSEHCLFNFLSGWKGWRDRGSVVSHKAGQGCRLQASSWGVGLLLLSHKASDTWRWFSRDTQWKIEYLNPGEHRNQILNLSNESRRWQEFSEMMTLLSVSIMSRIQVDVMWLTFTAGGAALCSTSQFPVILSRPSGRLNDGDLVVGEGRRVPAPTGWMEVFLVSVDGMVVSSLSIHSIP